MDVRADEVKAGLLIVVSLALLSLFLFLIFGINLGQETEQYTTYLGYVGGIQAGTLVKYGGMDVGHVDEILMPDPESSRIGVVLSVDADTPIKVDSRAFITSISLMSDPHIEISTGSPDAALLPPGSILTGKDVLSFTQMAEPLGELNEQVQELLERVVQIFDEENRSHFASMLRQMDSLMVDGRAQFRAVTDNLDSLSRRLTTLSATVNELMTTNRDNLNETLSNLNKTTQETSEAMARVRRMLNNLQGLVDTNSSSIAEIMENFQYASQNLEEFSRMVKERPWMLVRKAAPPEREIR